MENGTGIFHGNVVYSKSEKELIERENSYIVVEKGVVQGIFDTIPDAYKNLPVTDFGSDVMIPAFSDLHTHAPQYPQRGLKTDAILRDWLEQYTFPLEARYFDPDFAAAVYDAFIEDMIAHGTMHVVAFGTIHSRSTGYLMERLEQKGIASYVGKVNMDVNSPDCLRENTVASLRDTEAFLERYAGNRFAKPILTPRFAPTCSPQLLTGLGKLAKKYAVGVHTHLVESIWESETSIKVHQNAKCDTEIYERAGLLGYGPFVGAHFIFPSEEDVRVLKKYDGYAVHCPDATVNVIAGIMPSAALAEKGVRVAIGSDVAAGQSLSVYRQVASAVRLSKIKSFYEPQNRALTFAEAFYMATKQGGSLFGKTGSFERGYAFDALVLGGLSDPFLTVRPAEIVERFCAAGEKENIKARFLRGVPIK